MPRGQRPKGYINWVNSAAKEVVLHDLLEGGALHNMDHLTAEQVWGWYAQLPHFQSVPFEQFKARLADHRSQMRKSRERSLLESRALAHDRALYPRQLSNVRGEPVFDLSPAKLLLREDVHNGEHLNKTPSQFQATRPEYMVFSKDKFKHRIYQEERRQKFLFWLELQRIQKLRRSAARGG